jgi:molybdopterin-guanine dinucleotide biosynthesis protein A
MRRRFSEVTGFVLAGGASLRMGRPKERLVLGGEMMLHRQVRLLASVCRSVAVLGPPANFPDLDVPAFADELPGRGPLGGIYSGLIRTRTEYNLLLSCDLPFVEERFLHYLCRQAIASRAEVTVPALPEHTYQSLCAVYRRSARWAVRASLMVGENKARGIFSRAHLRVLSLRAISRAGFSPRIFDNMNTVQDYEAAKRLLEGKA